MDAVLWPLQLRDLSVSCADAHDHRPETFESSEPRPAAARVHPVFHLHHSGGAFELEPGGETFPQAQALFPDGIASASRESVRRRRRRCGGNSILLMR